MRIAIAGFQHETNTFVPGLTTLADFEQADSWPGLLWGDQVIGGTLGMNLPIAGFARAAQKDPDLTLCPILWCAAEPGGRVSDHAYDTITGHILAALDALSGVDAVYLDLHGAMITESLEDGEGALLTRIRQIIGPHTPLVASLDMHAHVTRAMVDASDAMTIFRTYPHLDMAQSGARAFDRLMHIRRNGPLAKAMRHADYLIPLHAQYTGSGPARRLYDAVAASDVPHVSYAELALGFTAGDMPDMGPCVVTYASARADAEGLADHLAEQVSAAESQFDCHVLTADEAVQQAIAAPRGAPVVLADVQDNPGAGASSDTTGLLRALIRHDVPTALIGLIHDPDLAGLAHAQGQQATFDAQIGGRTPGDCPVKASVRVHHLSDGFVRYTGEMYGGGVATLGLSAALQIVGTHIFVVVTSVRNQCLDRAHFTHFNLSPKEAQILCVKSTAHFRADFEPIAQAIVSVGVPGQFACALESVPYARLRPDVRRMPGRAAAPVSSV